MYRFKKAETDAELEQVFRLNHDVFAGELRQHSTSEEGRLVDKFHLKNLYLIALEDDRVVGMLTTHDQPPFSVADKLADVSVLEKYGRIVEVRLLAIEPEHRNRLVLSGLFSLLYEHVHTYDSLAISGYVEQAAMYHKLGFHDLGPPVTSGKAQYIPMAATIEELRKRAVVWNRTLDRWMKQAAAKSTQ
ncbi:MAG TPA: GNAT family N-acetyltransferase [Bryobacteraceae bacterium]|jgi:predicted N-acetyltransferase YhbS|nr:GNAT family N-acetyltransferase [Bryobacteraceae bacterium]